MSAENWAQVVALQDQAWAFARDHFEEIKRIKDGLDETRSREEALTKAVLSMVVGDLHVRAARADGRCP